LISLKKSAIQTLPYLFECPNHPKKINIDSTNVMTLWGDYLFSPTMVDGENIEESSMKNPV